VIRPYSDHSLVLLYRLVNIALNVQSFAKIEMSLDKVWVQRKCPTEMGNRLIKFTGNVVGTANVVMKLGNGAIQFNCPSNQINCNVNSADLMSNET